MSQCHDRCYVCIRYIYTVLWHSKVLSRMTNARIGYLSGALRKTMCHAMLANKNVCHGQNINRANFMKTLFKSKHISRVLKIQKIFSLPPPTPSGIAYMPLEHKPGIR